MVCSGEELRKRLYLIQLQLGASNDIEKATQMARAMITQYGMSEKFGLIGLESIQNRYLDGRPVMNCGEATAAEIDTEVMRILKEAYAEAKRLLSENRRLWMKLQHS